MRVLLCVSQRSIRWMISTQRAESGPMHPGGNREPSTWQCASQSCPVEEHSKARVYGYSNLYYSSSRVLNVMGKCQPTGKIQFLTRFAIIRSSWGCADVWRALMEPQRKGQPMQILFVQPNQKRESAFWRDGLFCPFFFETPSFKCHWLRPSARPQLRSQHGGTTHRFRPSARVTFVGEQNHFPCLRMLVLLLLQMTPGTKTLQCVPSMVLDYKDSTLEIRSIV